MATKARILAPEPPQLLARRVLTVRRGSDLRRALAGPLPELVRPKGNVNVSTFIVDDEPIARAGLRAMLGAFDWVEVVGEAADGESAVRAINELRPELVFLDVQMPGLLGTDVLRRFERPPFVIFTTAYSEHAVSAFERRGGLPAEAVRP